MEKIDIKPKIPSSEIKLDDKDFMTYLMLQELIRSINKLTAAIRTHG